MTGDQGRMGRRTVPELAESASERPGDPVCLLRRVCQACGAVAETDPPTFCTQCGSEIPAD